jgi:hypothetical protein
VNELLHLLGNPAHWGFEFITDLVFGGITFAWGRGWLRRHDRKVHGTS